MSVQVQLTKGFLALIDDADADLASHKWVFATDGYAQAWDRVLRRTVFMHRIILARLVGRALTQNELTDHINGNRLDNRRSNLRIATINESNRNRCIPKNNTSGVRGVSWNKKKRRWVASVMVDGRELFLGLFKELGEAKAARYSAEAQYYGEFSPMLSRDEL